MTSDVLLLQFFNFFFMIPVFFFLFLFLIPSFSFYVLFPNHIHKIIYLFLNRIFEKIFSSYLFSLLPELFLLSLLISNFFSHF